MNNWFHCKVRYEKEIPDAGMKVVTEGYLVDAVSVTEVEVRLRKELEAFVSLGDFSISSIKKEKITDLFLSPDEEDSFFYRFRLHFVVIDEVKGIEKKSPMMTIIVQAKDLPQAVNRFQKEMQNSIEDYTIVSVSEANIMDILQFE